MTNTLNFCLRKFLLLYFLKVIVLDIESYTIFFNVLISGCPGSLLLCAGFFQLSRAGTTLQLQCSGFSLRWLLLLQSTGSRAQGFSCPEACGIFWTRDQTVSPALAGRFLTIGPPGTSPPLQILKIYSLPLIFHQFVYHIHCLHFRCFHVQCSLSFMGLPLLSLAHFRKISVIVGYASVSFFCFSYFHYMYFKILCLKRIC